MSTSKEDAMALIKRIEENDPNLNVADLSRTELRTEGLECCLATALTKNTNLRRLFLGATGLGVSGMMDLAPAIANHHGLVEVHLGGNKIGDEGVIYLLCLLANNSTLKKLALNSNNITNVGVMAIAEFLRANDTIDWLWLESNDFGEQGSEVIQAALSQKGGCYLQVCGGGYWGDLIRDYIKTSTTSGQIRVVTESSRYVESKKREEQGQFPRYDYPAVRGARGPLALAIQFAIQEHGKK